MDELIAHIQEEVPWCMLFADDIVLVDELRNGMNVKLKRWPQALESKGLKISHTKTKYKNCNLSGEMQRYETPVTTEAQEIPQRDSFRYLSSMSIEEDVKHRISSRWFK